MKTVKKNAWNPNTRQEYKIDFPAPEEIKKKIPEIEFPAHGLMNREVADKLAKKFQLSDEQKNAKPKPTPKSVGNTFIFRDRIVLPTLRKLLSEGILQQPWGSEKPYTLADSNESIEDIYQKIRKGLVENLLQKIKGNSPVFFEKLVIDLLVAMGYWGSREDAGKAVGGSGDGGIDGIIKADPLGLNVVYIQAKRWEGNVGAQPLRDFVGALDGKEVQEGIFITTSDFNQSAKKFVERSSKRIILINGNQLAQYMIDHNVGVSTVETYEIKRVDSDYFAEGAESS